MTSRSMIWLDSCLLNGSSVRTWRRPVVEKDEGRAMKIQLNTDGNIEGNERLADHVTGVVEDTLGRFAERVTRVEVHLSDENGPKSGPDAKRCMMEARLRGRQPIAVTHEAETLDQAIDGAADKLQRLLDSTLERLDAHR